MEPRHYCRGNADIVAPERFLEQVSMEPRHYCRGNLRGSLKVSNVSMFQWSHDITVVVTSTLTADPGYLARFQWSHDITVVVT